MQLEIQQHENTDFASEILAAPLEILALSQKNIEIRAMRLRAVDRMQLLAMSPRKYSTMLKESHDEREYVELPRGSFPSANTLDKWRKFQDDMDRISRRVGGKGRKSTIPN